MAKKALIYGTALTIACICLYVAWQAVLYGREQLRHRFAEMHAFLGDDGSDFGEGLTDAEMQARDDAVMPVVSSDAMVPWELLSEATMGVSRKGGKEIPTPTYPESITLLNHHAITVRGFIFPLEQSAKQSHFLLSAYPPSCPYCLPAGPSELIEIWMKQPINFTYDAISLKGEFEYLEKDEDLQAGMFYRMRDGVVM